MSYITHYKLRLERRHYITDATTKTIWFNFSKYKLNEFISTYGSEFCMIINGSTEFDDAFILPFTDFRDFFTNASLKDGRRWMGYIRADDELIRLSPCRNRHERSGYKYYNAYHLLQVAPLPLPTEPDALEFI
jgi:hypothetical protein